MPAENKNKENKRFRETAPKQPRETGRNAEQVQGNAYDDVYHTLQNDCRKWCIPMINEIFEEQYTGNEQIIPAPNEHFINWQDGGEVKRITDSTFMILGRMPKKYHMECQSRPDGSMLVRMFEYDSQIALDDAKVEGYSMTVTFPRSAVLFLRHNRNTPDRMRVVVRTEAGAVSYDIPVVKLQDYTLQKIFDKKLLLFIPFYIFSYEKKFKEIEAEEGKMAQLQEDYRRIRAYLDGMCAGGSLTEFEKRAIIDMSKKVLDSIAARHPRVKEGVREIMGGKVLDYEAKDILNQGISQGMITSIKNLMRKKQMTAEEAMDALDIPEDEWERYRKLLSE